MVYIYLFFFVLFCIFTFVPSYDIYVYQCICCASFLAFSVLIIKITVTQLIQLFSYFGCPTTVCAVYLFIYLFICLLIIIFL